MQGKDALAFATDSARHAMETAYTRTANALLASLKTLQEVSAADVPRNGGVCKPQIPAPVKLTLEAELCQSGSKKVYLASCAELTRDEPHYAVVATVCPLPCACCLL